MALIVPQQGERRLLQRMLGVVPTPGNIYIGLFVGALIIPSETTTLVEMLAAEVRPSFEPNVLDSYARQEILAANWTIPVSGEGIATAIEKVFKLNGGPDGYLVHGYFVMECSDAGVTPTHLLWVEKFPSAYVINMALNGGGEIGITARIELD